MNSALVKWLYLPDFFTVPNSGNLMGQYHLSLMMAVMIWIIVLIISDDEGHAGMNRKNPFLKWHLRVLMMMMMMKVIQKYKMMVMLTDYDSDGATER